MSTSENGGPQRVRSRRRSRARGRERALGLFDYDHKGWFLNFVGSY